MRLKVFSGRTVHEAMAALRRALGDDAVILATEEGPDGVRVTAGIEVPADELDVILRSATPLEVVERLALALRFHQLVAIDGTMPNGGRNRVELAVCSVPALLAMKGHALQNRLKQKDAYDIYYCIRNYPDGIAALALACQPLLGHDSAVAGYGYIGGKFDSADGFGPTCVRRFVEESQILGGRGPDQWQRDAFGQVDAWLRALGMRR